METEQNNNQNSGQMPTPNMDADKPRAFGPAIGILIVVALLVIGGLYFWGSYLNNSIGDTGYDSEATSFQVLDTTVDEYSMTDEEFEALINTGADVSDPAAGAADATLDAALDDLGDLDNLDAELGALQLEL